MRERDGELVCTRPFPSMPVALLERSRRRQVPGGLLRRTIPDVWRHGDWARLTEHDGLVILGRSDATLNPGGVRIGTAEIYRQVEQLPEVVESLVVGQEWEGDVRIVLFVRLREGTALDEALEDRIRRRIRRAGESAPRAAQDRAGGRHPADDQRQDHRAGRARGDPRASRHEYRRDGESLRPGPVPRPSPAPGVGSWRVMEMTPTLRVTSGPMSPGKCDL